jgi:hypothetical protein
LKGVIRFESQNAIALALTWKGKRHQQVEYSKAKKRLSRGKKQESEVRSQEPEEKKICQSGFRLIILDSGF